MDNDNSAASLLQPLDISSLSLDDLDSMTEEALKAVLDMER